MTQDQTVLVIANPHPGGLNPDSTTLYDNIDFKNRICFLTGQRSFDSLLNAAKELKAIRHIIDELKSEGTPDNDPQLVQARDLLDRIQNQFGSALRETFSTLYYPSAQRLMSADFPMEFTANKYDGEDQIVRTLKAKMKYTEDVTGDTFVKKVEARLFTQKVMLWSEIKRRAATSPAWQWHRPDALDKLKADCLHREVWREDGGYVEKGPFPQPVTQVKIQELSRDDDTGRVKLRATPVNGDTIYVEIGAPATAASQKLSGRDYETDGADRLLPGGGLHRQATRPASPSPGTTASPSRAGSTAAATTSDGGVAHRAAAHPSAIPPTVRIPRWPAATYDDPFARTRWQPLRPGRRGGQGHRLRHPSGPHRLGARAGPGPRAHRPRQAGHLAAPQPPREGLPLHAPPTTPTASWSGSRSTRARPPPSASPSWTASGRTFSSPTT